MGSTKVTFASIKKEQQCHTRVRRRVTVSRLAPLSAERSPQNFPSRKNVPIALVAQSLPSLRFLRVAHRLFVFGGLHLRLCCGRAGAIQTLYISLCPTRLPPNTGSKGTCRKGNLFGAPTESRGGCDIRIRECIVCRGSSMRDAIFFNQKATTTPTSTRQKNGVFIQCFIAFAESCELPS